MAYGSAVKLSLFFSNKVYVARFNVTAALIFPIGSFDARTCSFQEVGLTRRSLPRVG